MMSEQVEKSKIGHERSQIITEANHERVLGKVYKKAKEEKKREKRVTEFVDEKLRFIQDKMSAKHEAAAAGLKDKQNNIAERLMQLNSKNKEKDMKLEQMLNQKEHAIKMLKEVHDLRERNAK